VSLNLDRNSIGYEINEEFLSIIKEKIGMKNSLLALNHNIEIIKQETPITIEETDYAPNILDAKPVISPDKFKFKNERLYKAVKVVNENTVELDTGLKVELLGVSNIPQESDKAKNYLEEYVKGKQVFLKFDPSFKPKDDTILAYLFLKNRIFINKEMIKQGLAKVPDCNFKYKDNFTKIIVGAANG
jgi:hypothetical protein